MKHIQLTLLIIISSIGFSQKLVKTYHDKYTKTKVYEKYYTDSYGTPNGSYKNYFEKGGLRESGTYVKGKKHGIWKEYYEIAEVNGQFGEAHCNGQILGIQNYKNGVKHGDFKQWTCQSGTKKLKEHERFSNDKKTYTCTYYTNGRKKLDENTVNGSVIHYYENGKLFYKYTNANGVKIDAGVWYYPNGKVYQKLTFGENYSLTNTWERYNRKGVLIYKFDFSNKDQKFEQYFKKMGQDGPYANTWGYGRLTTYSQEGIKQTEYKNAFILFGDQVSTTGMENEEYEAEYEYFSPTYVGQYISYYPSGKTKEQSTEAFNETNTPYTAEIISYYENGNIQHERKYILEERNRRSSLALISEKSFYSNKQLCYEMIDDKNGKSFYPSGKPFTTFSNNTLLRVFENGDTLVKGQQVQDPELRQNYFLPQQKPNTDYYSLVELDFNNEIPQGISCYTAPVSISFDSLKANHKLYAKIRNNSVTIYATSDKTVLTRLSLTRKPEYGSKSYKIAEGYYTFNWSDGKVVYYVAKQSYDNKELTNEEYNSIIAKHQQRENQLKPAVEQALNNLYNAKSTYDQQIARDDFNTLSQEYKGLITVTTEEWSEIEAIIEKQNNEVKNAKESEKKKKAKEKVDGLVAEINQSSDNTFIKYRKEQLQSALDAYSKYASETEMKNLRLKIEQKEIKKEDEKKEKAKEKVDGLVAEINQSSETENKVVNLQTQNKKIELLYYDKTSAIAQQTGVPVLKKKYLFDVYSSFYKIALDSKDKEQINQLEKLSNQMIALRNKDTKALKKTIKKATTLDNKVQLIIKY